MNAQNNKYFEHAILAKVMIIASGETGDVVARMDALDDSDMYKVRYRNALGLATEQWWSASALTPLVIN